jgi:hypothetical protein
MRRLFTLSLLGLLAGSFGLLAQDETPVRSGPKEGKFLPAPFDCFMFNGDYKGRFHAPVCRYALDPFVLVFAREPEEGKDAALTALVKRLEEAAADFKKHSLHAGLVFLSPDAQGSVTNPDETDPAKLVEEAKKRTELHARLAARAENLKGIDVGVMATPGPKDYEINPKVDVTVVLCHRMRVVLSRAFEQGKPTDEEIDKLLAKVKETLEPPAPPKKTKKA